MNPDTTFPASRPLRGMARFSAPSAALLLLFFLVPPGLHAQEAGTIRGHVVTGDGIPATDAEVRLLPSGRSVRVDEDGSFAFPRVLPGRYLLEVNSLRGGQALERVSLAPGGVEEITIRLSPLYHLDELIVTAGTPTRRDEAYQATSVLTGRDLDARAEATLGETLQREPGVNATYFGPGSSRPVIRGLGGDRVRILEGGVGVGDASGASPDHAVGLEPLGAERIEIVRGPATLLYGSSAIGGVVNVLDDRIARSLPAKRVEGTLLLRAGTVADERAGSASASLRLGSLVANVSGTLRETGDYDIPGVGELDPEPGEEVVSGFLPNTSLETDRLGAGLSWVGEQGYLGVAVSGYGTRYGVPGGHGHEEHEEGEEPEGGEEHEEEAVRIDLEQRRVDVEGDYRVDGEVLRGLRLRVGRSDYEHTELEGAEIGTRFFNEQWEGRIEARHRLGDVTTGSLGFQLLSRDFRAVGEEAFVPPTETRSWAAFLFQEFGGDEVRFQVGTRVEVRSVDAEDDEVGDRDFHGVSISGGVNWSMSDAFGLALSLSRSEKLPSAEELFSDGPHLATGAFERGDPELNEEVALSGDVTVRYRGERARAELTGFATSFDDFTFQALTAEEVDGLPVLIYTQGTALHFGAEWSAEWEVLHLGDDHLAIETYGDWVRAELSANDEPLPRIPPLRAGLGLTWDGGEWRSRIGLLHVTDQDRTAPLETPTEGYTTVDATVSYRFLRGEMAHDFILQGTNLTDTLARSHVSLLKDVAPLPGRDVRLMYRLTF